MQSKVARIHDVGTLPEYQNKGYATQLMKHAINEAINLGADYCFLEASESGLSVYQKLGFKPLFKNNYYTRSE
jgi:ribosomal protein S18 acetylase RimI-like enzyme